MILGVTGTSGPTTTEQISWLWQGLQGSLKHEPVVSLHHGDCIGVDDIAHSFAEWMHIPVVIHPPDNDKKRAFCQSEDVREPKPYLDRNHDIVDECEFLLAVPAGPEILRSGTWATVRYARKVGRPGMICYPDGVVNFL